MASSVLKAAQKKSRKKHYLGGVDIYRHAMAIGVIFIHTKSHREPELDTAAYEWISIITGGTVLGFFIASGYFSVTTKPIFQALRNKAARLLLPFFIFSIIYAILLSALGKQALIHGLRQSLLFPGASMQLYFLPELFAISTIFLFFLYFQKAWHTSIFSIILIVTIVASIFLPTSSTTGPAAELIPLYSTAFVAGVLVRQQGISAGIAIGIICILIGFGLDQRFFYLTATAWLFILAIKASTALPCLQKPFPGSGGVYLLHTPIINFSILAVLSEIGVHTLTNKILTVAATYLLCLGITLLLLRTSRHARVLLLE